MVYFLATKYPEFGLNFTLLFYRLQLRVCTKVYIIITCKAFSVPFITCCSGFLKFSNNNPIPSSSQKRNIHKVNPDVSRYSLKLFVVPKELVSHLSFLIIWNEGRGFTVFFFLFLFVLKIAHIAVLWGEN